MTLTEPRLVTRAQAAAYVAEHCPSPIDVTRLGAVGPEYICNCGTCPKPDPTPAEFSAMVDAAWWAVQHEVTTSAA